MPWAYWRISLYSSEEWVPRKFLVNNHSVDCCMFNWLSHYGRFFSALISGPTTIRIFGIHFWRSIFSKFIVKSGCGGNFSWLTSLVNEQHVEKSVGVICARLSACFHLTRNSVSMPILSLPYLYNTLYPTWKLLWVKLAVQILVWICYWIFLSD